MLELKFLHCSDVHLDTQFTSLSLVKDIPQIRKQDLKEVFKKIISIAKDENVDVLLMSGDLYENNYIKKSSINFINDLFESIKEIEVFLICGNHDPYILNSYYKNFEWSENVHILSEENPVYKIDKMNVNVYGVGFKDFFESDNYEKNISNIDKECINILLTHATVDFDKFSDKYNSVSSEYLNSLGMDYIGVGHFHNRKDNIGGYGYIYNPGSPEPLGFDEEGQHGVYIGNLIKDSKKESKLDIEFINTSKRNYFTVEIDVDGVGSDEELIDTLKDFFNDREKQDLYCVILKGYVDREYKINISEIIENIKKCSFYITIKDETIPDYNFEDIMQDLGIKGRFVRRMMENIEKETCEIQKIKLRKALYYGLEALETGKVNINM